MKKKPRKPTEPFGYISFGRDKTVRRSVFRLSNTKEIQESQVMQTLIEGVNRMPGNLTIEKDLHQLPPPDHDFRIVTSEGPVIVEVTELVERDYTRRISKESYQGHEQYIVKDGVSIPLVVDSEKVRMSLRKAIEKKVDKHYAKASSETLWLVVYCTSIHPLTEYWQNGELKVSDALAEARRYLSELEGCVFDKIWYTNLITNPVCIWPETPEKANLG